MIRELNKMVDLDALRADLANIAKIIEEAGGSL
jgi:hypothetical protein